MKIITRRGPLAAKNAPAAVALGQFDGLHLGHRAVIEAAARLSAEKKLKLAVFTIPPAAGSGGWISSQTQKHALLEGLGVDICYEPPFESFRTLSPKDFFDEMLLREFGAAAITCGPNFRYGLNAAGDTPLLRDMCAISGLALSVPQMLLAGGEAVSSSRIRQALIRGDIPAANAMLGRPYAILAAVVHGRRLGRTLGFPTINQHFAPGILPPAHGVYATRTFAGGAWRASVTGWGTRPTVGGGTPVCETFIIGFDGEMYGDETQVRFYKKISEIRRFSCKDKLAEAVRCWAKEAEKFFEDNPLALLEAAAVKALSPH